MKRIKLKSLLKEESKKTDTTKNEADDTFYPQVRTKEYPELRSIVDKLTMEVVKRIQDETKKVQSQMPYKEQWVLEELVKSLNDQV